MPTSFPTGLDSFTNPAATDDVSVVTHDTQHANANDAIKALETKVGINSSADTSSIDYILTNLASLVSSITIDSLLPSQTGQSGNFLTTDGTSASWGAAGGGSGADPTASVGLSAVNGSATTFLRSDGAPALDVSIAPTWTGQHVHSLSNASAWAIGPNGDTNPVLRIVTNTASQADGLSITGLAAGSGVTLAALSSGSNAPITLLPKGTGDGILGCMRSFVEGTQQVAVSIQNASAPASGDQHTLYLGQTAYTQYLRGGYGLDMIINNSGGTNINLSANYPAFVNLQQSGTTILSVGGSAGVQGVFVNQTAAASTPLTLQATASPTAPQVRLKGISSTSVREQAEIDVAWTDSTDATRSADLVLRAYYTSSALEGIRVRGTSGGAAIAFLGGTPAVQQANASQTAITAVLDANAQSALQAIYNLLAAYNLAPATA